MRSSRGLHWTPQPTRTSAELAPALYNPIRKFIMPETISHTDAQFHFASFTQEAHDLQPGLPAGPVRIRYSCHQWNEVVKRSEPVYACYRASDRSSLGTWYKTALERFSK